MRVTQAGIASVAAAMFVEGFDDAAQQFGNVREGEGWVDVGFGGEERGIDWAAGWIGDELFHGYHLCSAQGDCHFNLSHGLWVAAVRGVRNRGTKAKLGQA